MEDSILNSIKLLLGINPDIDAFDKQLVMYINGVFVILKELGLGVDKNFRIEDASSEWTEYISNEEHFDLVKPYIYGKVRLMFDPPANATLLQCLESQVAEYESRISYICDPGEKED